MVVSLHESDWESSLKGLRDKDCLNRASRPCLDDRDLCLDAKSDVLQFPFDLRIWHGILETLPNGDRTADREQCCSIFGCECLARDGHHRVVSTVTPTVFARQVERIHDRADLSLKIDKIPDNPCTELHGVVDRLDLHVCRR